MSEPWTIRRVVRWSAEDFAQRGLASPRLDAELLVAHALGLSRVKLYMDLDRELTPDELIAVRALVQRRRKREPVAYLVGTKEFWGRPFVVSSAVLIPRPDTETLVERALALIPGGERRKASAAGSDLAVVQREADARLETRVEPIAEAYADANAVAVADADAVAGAVADAGAVAVAVAHADAVKDADAARVQPFRLLDLCTGTGCIGLTLACERPGIEAVLTDLSPEALAVARQNGEALAAAQPGLPGRVTFGQGDLFGAVTDGARFDLVTCNPPYLSHAELDEVERDVREHEPTMALVGGALGDEVIERVARDAPRHLLAGGVLLVEIGPEQGERARAAFERAGLVSVTVLKDLAGRDRVVEGHAR